jgi:hypothetical protein
MTTISPAEKLAREMFSRLAAVHRADSLNPLTASAFETSPHFSTKQKQLLPYFIEPVDFRNVNEN